MFCNTICFAVGSKFYFAKVSFKTLAAHVFKWPTVQTMECIVTAKNSAIAWRHSSTLEARAGEVITLETNVKNFFHSPPLHCPEINPDEAGCTYNRQCSAVWPGAYCSNGECKCAHSLPAFVTNQGKVCLNYGHCPTNANNAIYRGDSGEVENCFDDLGCGPGYECICSDQLENCRNPDVVTFCCPMRGKKHLTNSTRTDFPVLPMSQLNNFLS